MPQRIPASWRALRVPAAIVLCVLVLARCRSAGVPSLPQQRPDFAAIDAMLDEQRRALHLPGVAFAVVDNDRVVHVATLGWRDIEHNLPVTEDTVFPIGSCTKAFTSMAVALAADRHLLSLDDHPRRFLPYFQMADPIADAKVTLRDMLSHRTGLKAYADLAAEPGVLNREDYVRAATGAKPVARFRSKFQYSNAMYSAVGEILGRVYGSTWEHAIEEQIFAPLQMRSSTTSALRMSTIAKHATGYVYDATSSSFHGVPPPRSLEALAPGGNVASTLRDMTAWLRMLTGGGRFGRQQFVSPAMFNATTSYALGWATYEWNGLGVVEHNGGSEGLSALVSFIPERRIGFVFLANTSPSLMTKVGYAAPLVYARLLRDVASQHATTTLPAAPAQAPKNTAAEITTTGLPGIASLVARMVTSIGGEDALRRHTSVELHALKNYENQGVSADDTLQEETPARRNEFERWSAAGKQIATLRVYFDGVTGGQETTFGQDAINGEEENRRAREDATLHPLLELNTLYKTATVAGATTIDDTPVWIVQLTPDRGTATTLYVAQQSALILKREREGETATFSDYTEVDGELIPFRTVINDSLGETTIHVRSAQFNATFSTPTFKASNVGH
jgi:CubicO group peptidase (beta-lactamase class C family)